MQRERMEALLRREVGHGATADRLPVSDAAAPHWRGRAQTITLMRERMQALQEQYAAACAAGRPCQNAVTAAPAMEAATCSAADGAAPEGPVTPSCGAVALSATALPAVAVRGRYDAAHRTHIATMIHSAQVGLCSHAILCSDAASQCCK